MSPQSLLKATGLASLLLLSPVFALNATDSNSTNSSPLEMAETAAATLQNTWYNTTSGLWNTCGWWNAANNMIALADLATIDRSELARATAVFNTTFHNAPAFNPSLPAVPPLEFPWLDSCHDDDGWWALSWIAAYDLTSNPAYLSTAESIFANMSAAWPGPCGAGIVWCTNVNYTNAVTNELFLDVSAHLAARVPASKKRVYLDWALQEWEFFSTSGMINANNTINDGLTTDGTCVNNGQTVWSYNQGVILGGLVELNKISPNPSYIAAAKRIATGAIKALTNSDGIVVESCEPNCDSNQTQFKGIFIRNLLQLWLVSPNELYKNVIEANAKSIWANDRTAQGELGADWTGPVVDPNASTHGSALEALIMAASLRNL